MKHLLKVFAIVILLSATNLYADVIYVKQGASGTGASWTDAFGTLQQALTASTSGDEIWVAEGTYYPTTQVGGSGERFRTFQMKNGVTIYGGFPASGNPDMGDREWTTYETILSGDIGTLGDNSDNCYHVFYHTTGLNLDDTAIINGVTITAGNANGSFPHHSGGGMYNNNNSPTITNCKFSSNYAGYGAGIYNDRSNSNITNCTFSNNSATSSGGGIYNLNFSPTISNSRFHNNSATSSGGGMLNHASNSTINNCTFSYNSADSRGGGLTNFNNSNPTINNSTFSHNSATEYGGGIDNSNSSPTINNSIIWGNTANNNGNQIFINGGTTTLYYSCYANGIRDVYVPSGTFTVTNNNITDDPLFVGSGEHPYSLHSTSLCIDAGDNDLVPGGITTDIIGNQRIRGASVDLGAYESEFYTLDVSITPYEKTGICYDSPVALVENAGHVTVVGGEGELTYSWSPSFLVDHPDPSSPVASLTRTIRNAVYTLIVTDANGMQGTATVSVEVLAGNVISAPGTVVHSFRAEEITSPLNLFALALGTDYLTAYSGYTFEFECRLGWLPPGEESCEEFNPEMYIPLPNSRLYGWIIIKHSGGCEADRRRINVIVRGNKLEIEEEG